MNNQCLFNVLWLWIDDRNSDGGIYPDGERADFLTWYENWLDESLEQVRSVLSSTNANASKGHLSDGQQMWEVGANDQLLKAVDYRPLLIAYNNGSALHLSDIAQVQDSVEDVRSAGYTNGNPSVLVIIFRQPGANIIDTVDRVRFVIPQLKASIPQSINLAVALDQTVTIRASVSDVERALIIAVILVILVVFAFLGAYGHHSFPALPFPCRSSGLSAACIYAVTRWTTCL